MLQLGLRSEHCLDYDCLDLVPNLAGWFRGARLSLLGRRLRHDSLQAVVQGKFVRVVIEMLILLVQRVVGQVGVRVVKVCIRIVLFGGKSHEAIFVKENCQRVNHGGHKYIDAEVVLVALPESGCIQILLNDVAGLALVEILIVLLLCGLPCRVVEEAGNVATCRRV